MVATNRTLRLAVLAALGTLVVGCPAPPDECSVKTVRFITPTDGAQVNPNIDVQVEGLNASNERVAVESATLSVRAEGAAQAGTPLTGQLEMNVATFRGVMLQSGLSTLEAKVKQKASCAEVSGSVAVSARSTAVVPKVTRVSFPQDTNNDGVLNAAEWPVGSTLRVNVQAAEAFGLSVQIKQGAAIPGGPVAISTTGTATVDLSRLTPNDVTQGTLDFFAELTDGSMPKNNASGNPEAVASIQVRRSAPTCANTTRLLNGPAQDADTARPGFQLRATGTVGSNVTQVTFSIPSVAAGAGSNAGGMTSADLTLPATGDAVYQLTMTATDATGNACADTKAVRVDLEAPTVVITEPARPDGGTPTLTSSPVTVRATTTSPSGMACFFRRQGTAPRTQIGCATVASGMASLQVSFPASGAYELTVEITDDAGNVGTASLPVNVNLAGCGVAFTAPAMCPTTLFAGDLIDGGVAVAFTGGNCAAQPARLLVNSAVAASGTISVGETFGPVVVPLSSGSNTLRAEATNLQGGMDFATCDVTVDTSVPTFISPAPLADGGVVALNATQDSQAGTPGAQRVLSFTANVPTGGRVDVCTTQAVDPVTTNARTACPDGATGWFLLRSAVTSPDPAFTFPEGTYSLKLVVVSGTRFNVSASLALTVDVTPPCVADGGLVFDRDDGNSVPAFAQDGRLNVAEYAHTTLPFASFTLGCGDTQGSLATNGIVLRQIVSGAPTDLESGLTQTVAFSGGRVTLGLTGLTGVSSRTYFVELRDQAGNVNVYAGSGDFAAKPLDVDLAGPSCTLTAPNGALLGPAQVPSGVLTASLTTSADVTDAGVTFTLSGPSSPAPQTQTLNAGVATATFAVTGDASWSLAARCLDPAGNRADATTWTGRIDLVAPTVSITAPPNQADGGAPLVSTSPATATISTDAPGGQACFFLRAGSGPRTQVGCAAISGGAASQALSFPASGAYELSVDVTDPAGNLGTAQTSLTANLDGCAVAFTQPTFCGATLFASDLVDGGVLADFTGGNCVGQPARLLVNSTQVSAGTIGAGATYGAVLAPLGNGLNTLRAEATNLQAGVNFSTCDVTVDLSVPVFTNPAQLADGGVVAINALQDGQSAVPGAQRSLVFTATVPAGGRVDVCTTQAVDPATSMTRSACPDGVNGWYLLRQSVVSPESAFTYPNGDYALRLVVVVGGRLNSSLPMNVSVDVERPCVGGAGVRFDRDTGAGTPTYADDGHLNVAEHAQTSLPFLSFPLGCGDSQSTLSQTTAVVVRQVVAGSVTNLPAGVTQSVTFGAGRIDVALGGLTGEVTRNFFVELTDLAGNKNLYGGAADTAVGPLTLDLVAPTCAVTAPSAALLGPSQVPSGVLGTSVSTAADVTTGGVTFTLTGPSTPAAQNVTVGGGVATASFAVSGDNTWTLAVACRDPAGNATNATSWTGRIDLEAPTCSITAPSAGSTSSSRTNAISVSVTGAEGRPVTVHTNVPPSTLLATLTVASGVASGSAQFNNGTQTLTANVSDAVGNTCQATGGFTVAAPNCNLSLNGLYASSATAYWVNAATAGITSLTAHTSDCGGGKTVTLTKLPSTVIGSPATDSNGDVTFSPFAPVDGDSYTVMIDDGSGAQTTLTLTVDTQAPQVSGVSINGVSNFAADGGIRVVAATTNANVRANAAGFFVDEAPGSLGGQFSPQVTVDGGVGGVLRATLGASTLATQAISANGPQGFAAPLSVPQNTTGALSVVVVDPANNSTPVLQGQLVVDVVPPGAITPDAGTPTRNGAVVLSWTAVTDDVGTPASGPPANHEVRWTTSSVPGNAEMQSEMDYFATVSVVEPLVAGSAVSVPVSLPPLNKYYLAVRAIDELGNYGAFVAPPSGPAAVSNLWNTITLSDTTANSLFGTTVAVADLNGDGNKDIVVGAQAGNGAVYVYAGGPALTSQTGCLSNCQRIDPPSGTGFGNDVAVEGDLDNDGRADLVVAQPGFNNGSFSVGRALVYWGVSSGGLSTVTGSYLEFQGDTQARAFATTARYVGDIDNDGFVDLAIASTGWKSTEPDGGALIDPNEAGIGRVFIYRGRARASWPSRVLTPADADWILQGPTPRIGLGNTANGYGQNRLGLVPLGDINSDGQSDFTIPLSRPAANRLQLWSGRALHDPMAVVVPPVLVQSTSALQVLNPDAQFSSANGTIGYGAAAIARNFRDLVVGTPRQDLAISHPQQARIDLHLDLTATGTAGPPVQIRGQNFFGSSMAAADLNGDGRLDLVTGEVGSPPNSAWLLFQQPNGSFGDLIGSAPNPWVAQVKGGSASSQQGYAVQAADVTGDGAADFVYSDRANGIQTVTVRW